MNSSRKTPLADELSSLDTAISPHTLAYVQQRTKNNLYLLAMECEVKNYKEERYNHFINSFEISK